MCVYIPIYLHTCKPSTPTTSGDEEEAPSGRSRLYARSLCAVWPRMGKRRNRRNEILGYGANAGRGQAKYGAAG